MTLGMSAYSAERGQVSGDLTHVSTDALPPWRNLWEDKQEYQVAVRESLLILWKDHMRHSTDSALLTDIVKGDG